MTAAVDQLELDHLDWAVLRATVELGRAGWEAIAERASALAGERIYDARGVQPNVCSILDGLSRLGLVESAGWLDRKSAETATTAGCLAVGMRGGPTK